MLKDKLERKLQNTKGFNHENGIKIRKIDRQYLETAFQSSNPASSTPKSLEDWQNSLGNFFLNPQTYANEATKKSNNKIPSYRQMLYSVQVYQKEKTIN